MEAAGIEALSQSSVRKAYDPYADVDWDAPEHHVDPDDPRFELSAEDALGATAWYRALPPVRRARVGLHLAAQRLQVGIEFERVLMRGLLELAGALPSEDAAQRYAYHEVVEEARHSLMFREAVLRTGMPVQGLSAFDRRGAARVPRLGRVFPELFFVHVLGGETPIDRLQRAELRRGDALHPLLRRIMQIHVTEEARHVRFAEIFLTERVPLLSPVRRFVVAWAAPTILWGTVRAMLEVPRWFAELHGIPRALLRAIHRGPAHRAAVTEGVRPILTLFDGLGLVSPASRRLWRALGLCR